MHYGNVPLVMWFGMFWLPTFFDHCHFILTQVHKILFILWNVQLVYLKYMHVFVFVFVCIRILKKFSNVDLPVDLASQP